MSKTLTPLGKNVVLVPVSEEKVTSGGIYLPEDINEKTKLGEVVKGGDSLMEGQVVVFKEWLGKNVKIDGKEYIIVNIEDILATVS